MGTSKNCLTENGLKRYELTETGNLLLNEQKDLMKKFKETMGFPQPPFSAFFMKMPPEKIVEIQSTMRRAGAAMFQLSSLLQENFFGQALNEAIQAIDEASKKLEDIAKKLQGEENESI